MKTTVTGYSVAGYSARRGVVVLGVLGTVLAGCRTTGAWSPSETAEFERLAVTSTSRSGNLTTLEYGDYRADAIDRSWARGSGLARRSGGTATNSAAAEQEYSFTLTRAGAPRLLVACRTAGSRGGAAIRSVEIEAAVRLSLQCTLADPDGDQRWRMQLDGPGEHAMQGWLMTGAEPVAVTADRHGPKLIPQGARGYRFRSGDAEVAAVDVREKVVWLRRITREAPASADHAADALAAAAGALLLFESPLPDG